MRYEPYISVAEKKAKAEKLIKKLSKKESVEPLLYYNVKKEKAWWATKWEENILSYSDYENRISRGKAYVKNGFVIDFKISEGEIEALVMGSKSKPYKVNVNVNKLSLKNEKLLTEIIKGKISSLESFIKGDFPKELEDILVDSKYGLFPKPNEIKFSCSCPDGANMCKHVAAVLFGVSSKLTENPLLFFVLRGIDVNELIKTTVDETVEKLLENTSVDTSRLVSEDEALDLFNV